ncbi:MAG: hypothetical protein ABJC13_06230 [Acidobacteriota bacterium]
MRLAPLAVVGFLAVRAAFALPQDNAGTPVKPAESAKDDAAKPGTKKDPANNEGAAPTPRKLDLESNRNAGWCGSAKGPGKVVCLGPGDTLIVTVGGEGGLVLPHLCLDGKIVPLKNNPKESSALGGNRFGYEISSLPKNLLGTVEGHQVSLTAAATANCSTPITQLVDVAVTQPRLEKTTALLLFLGLSLLVLVLVRIFPGLLKEPDPKPDPNPNPVGARPWSLGRTQLAWWTAIVFSGWIVILVSTGNYESFTPEALILLGVSVATTATAGVMQKGKEQEKAKADEAKNEVAALRPNLTAGAAPADAMAAGQRMQQIAGEQKVAPVYQTNVGFFSDLLKDGDAPSLARLQAVLWTVALGAIFVWQVLSNMEMPAFSKELLFLAGISSGSFLFGKFNERRI